MCEEINSFCFFIVYTVILFFSFFFSLLLLCGVFGSGDIAISCFLDLAISGMSVGSFVDADSTTVSNSSAENASSCDAKAAD